MAILKGEGVVKYMVNEEHPGGTVEERLLLAEMRINEKVATEVFGEFGVAIRVHLSGPK